MKSPNPICISCNCKELSLFSTCNNQELQRIISGKSCRIYKKNQMVFAEGEKPQGLFCIESGKVKITKTNRDGKEQIIRIAIPGDNLGYHSLITNENYPDSGVVIEDAAICFIPRNEFSVLLSNSFNFNRELLRRLSMDFIEAEDFIKNMAFKPVRERMAYVFMLLKKTYNHTDNSELQISISRGDLANLAGTAKETATRLLTEFKEENIILTEGKNIKVIDWEKLERISQLYE